MQELVNNTQYGPFQQRWRESCGDSLLDGLYLQVAGHAVYVFVFKETCYEKIALWALNEFQEPL